MISFWFSLFILICSWGAALFIEGINAGNILISGLFFSLYFILPLLKYKLALIVLFILPILLSLLFFSPVFNPFLWLIYIVLTLQASSTFKDSLLYSYAGLLTMLAVAPYILFQEWLYMIFVLLLSVTTCSFIYYWRQTVRKNKSLEENNNMMHHEYLLLKRQVVNSEESARQEERNQIARELHDSVGHRLTALLMQIEVARLQASDIEVKDKLEELKNLAQGSLHDTREAVRALKSEESAGLQAVIQLIRKLESESHLRVSITMQSGVLGVIFSNQQSVAVYRSIQEALTNMMRHSGTRQATIEFQLIAGVDFKFQISHSISKKVQINEGFGLSNMRERLAQINGKLTISQVEGEFSIIGQFPLKEGQHD